MGGRGLALATLTVLIAPPRLMLQWEWMVMDPKRPWECADMSHVRIEIDRIDEALVDLISERFGYVDRAWQLKRNTPEGATVPWRIQQVIDKLVTNGFTVHRSTGVVHTVLGCVGPKEEMDPRDLELICAKCLSLDPRDRYAGADELAKDLRRLAAGEPVTTIEETLPRLFHKA